MTSPRPTPRSGKRPTSRTLAYNPQIGIIMHLLRRTFPFPFFFLSLVLTACGESSTAPPPPLETEVGVVVNSVEISLTVFDVEDPASVRTIPLGAEGTPVSASLRGELALVPMGVVPTAVVVDLVEGRVLRSIALPQGSGATGSAFLNDSIALVSNPDRNSVSPVNVLRGTAGAEIPVGQYPGAIVVGGGKIFVVNANLETFSPVGNGSVTVLDAGTLAVRGTIPLSAENSGGAVVGGGGRLYVVNAGNWGAENGTLSEVDMGNEVEVTLHEGFGNFPGGPRLDPTGRILVSSWSFGAVVWNPSSGSFVRSPADPLTVDGVASSPGVGVDPEGRIYLLSPECQGPARVHRFSPTFQAELTIPVGVCPSWVGFTSLVQ